MKTGKIILIATWLFVATNQGLYAGLFDTIKELKIENPSCLECDVKIAEWQNQEESTKSVVW
ncbi:hypothetical protein [Dapis sp. BLCC M172]|uniref:hypothetical protein n=1 Tax=Dapis sp. BLCC M172 TaxID=2975281 RepID=UPI003CF42C20